MSELQKLIRSMMYPCEYVGGPLDGTTENAIAAPFVGLPFEEGGYVLVEETEDGRLIYEWRI